MKARISSFYIVAFSFNLILSCATKENANSIKSDVSWEVYRGDDGRNAYSILDQVNTQNVGGLVPAWTYHTGDTLKGSAIQCNPLIIDGILYGTSPRLKVFALDAATGQQKWEFNPFDDDVSGGKSRGLSLWKKGDEKRVFHCITNYLIALDADTGIPIDGFGSNGRVDLREGLDVSTELQGKFTVDNSSPGVVYNDFIIIGSSMGEASGAPPGHLRAYDVRSGELKWIFHTIPHPGEFGYETWPEDYYKTGGGANAWSGLSVDKGRGMVFAALGAPTHDFYGGDRKGDGLFGNSIVALDANTGEYIWHFQVSHHDLWDYDLPSPPNLATIPFEGKPVDVVVQITKQGLIFVLDRETGKPIHPVEERPVPQSSLDGEYTSPTQPFPSKPAPLVRHHFDETLVTDISEESHRAVMNKIKGLTLGGIYTPPAANGTVQLPGFRGGAEWSGAAIDPVSNKLYVGLNDIPNIVELIEPSDDKPEVNEHGEIDMVSYGISTYLNNCAACHGQDRKGINPFPSLVDVSTRIVPKDVHSLLRSGRGMMPSFAHLSDMQREAVVKFLFENKNISGSTQKRTFGGSKKLKLKAYKQLLDQNGYPGIKPPWGSLCAVDLVTGEVDWKVPLGEYPELTKKGIVPTGTQLFGGGVITAGGVIFIGASKDEKFRAIDQSDGKVLWEYQLPAGGYATPATYAIDGVQYIVIAAGGGGFQVTKSSDTYMAFRLSTMMLKQNKF